MLGSTHAAPWYSPAWEHPIQSLGSVLFPNLQAPCEAEAQCAAMTKAGVVGSTDYGVCVTACVYVSKLIYVLFAPSLLCHNTMCVQWTPVSDSTTQLRKDYSYIQNIQLSQLYYVHCHGTYGGCTSSVVRFSEGLTLSSCILLHCICTCLCYSV